MTSNPQRYVVTSGDVIVIDEGTRIEFVAFDRYKDLQVMDITIHTDLPVEHMRPKRDAAVLVAMLIVAMFLMFSVGFILGVS